MKSKYLNRIGAVCVILGISACASSIKKAEIPENANPTEEVTRLEQDLQKAYDNQVDLYAYRDLNKAKDRLEEARENLEEGEQNREVLSEVAYGRAYLDRAVAFANQKMNTESGITKARQSAIEAGVMQNPRLAKLMTEVDEDLRDDTNNFTKNLKAEKFAEFQKSYLDLELEAIQSKHLGTVRAQIASAEDDRAKRKAPKSYSRAVLDLKEAENEILADRHNPGRFETSVNEAKLSAQILTEVMRTLRNGKRGMSEDVAIQIVQQNRTIAGLKDDLSSTQGQLSETQSELSQTSESLESQSKTLSEQSAALSESERKIRLQEALAKAQEEFSEDEAEVYQRGDQLVIRLKKMNFPSGQASLPAESMTLLDKVSEVAKGLNPEEIIVEGHTDSVGGARVNKALSQERAEAVAGYLESVPELGERIQAVGRGYERPIAPNKTREGRAMNRRVDIVITPESGAAEVGTETE